MMAALPRRDRVVLVTAMVLSTMPLWLVQTPPLTDLLGHMGRYHLQLSLERAGVHGRLIGPHQIQFESHGRRLTLVHDLVPGTLAELQHGRGLHIYDLRDSSARTEISCEANPAE